jgi:hypothetical protein
MYEPVPPIFLTERPGSFRERGVMAPFTTPSLFGARIRADERGRLEVMQANPVGGMGCYIVPLRGLREITVPTVHDRWVAEWLLGLKRLLPSIVRRLDRRAAMLGLAGPRALVAARRQESAERRAQARIRRQWLRGLGAGEGGGEAEALAPLAARFKVSPAWLARGLDELSHIAALVGTGEDEGEGFAGRAMVALADLRDDLRAWAQRRQDQEVTMLAALLAYFTEVVLDQAGQALDEAHQLLGAPRPLLERFAAEPDKLLERLRRPEWVLDGWDLLLGLWQQATTRQAQRRALREMIRIAPPLPREILGPQHAWPEEIEALAATLPPLIKQGEPVEEIAMIDLIARNEALLRNEFNEEATARAA